VNGSRSYNIRYIVMYIVLLYTCYSHDAIQFRSSTSGYEDIIRIVIVMFYVLISHCTQLANDVTLPDWNDLARSYNNDPH
jgi:hypothetical protein